VAARGIFHSHGSAGDLRKDQVLRYFRKVNRALREVLAGEGAPMVLAAVEHLAPLWRQVNTYPHLVDQVVAGSPEELSLHQLHARAWAVVEPLFLQALGEAAGKYHQLAGTGLTSRDPREIIRAAEDGRVEALFAAWQPTGVGGANGSPSPNGDRALRDVLELAAVTTLLKGGTVYALPAGAAPGGGSAVAVLRYQARVSQDRTD
jgi:Bacterial archaeo-eukaryotic release factor family 3